MEQNHPGQQDRANILSPDVVVMRSPKAYKGLMHVSPISMAQKLRAASNIVNSDSSTIVPTVRSASTSQAPISTIPEIPEDLPQTYQESLNAAQTASQSMSQAMSRATLQTTSRVFAYFSYDGCKQETRSLPHLKPAVVARSDPKRDTDIMIKNLRARYPHVCNSIFAHSSWGHDKWEISWFFDEWDFHVLGPAFLYNVVLTMQAQNEDAVSRIVDNWSERNKAYFPWIPNQNLGIEQMFAQQDREKFGDEFCRVCLRMIQVSYARAYEQSKAALFSPLATPRQDCVAVYTKMSENQMQASLPTTYMIRGTPELTQTSETNTSVPSTCNNAHNMSHPQSSATNTLRYKARASRTHSENSSHDPVSGRKVSATVRQNSNVPYGATGLGTHLLQNLCASQQIDSNLAPQHVLPFGYQQPPLDSLQYQATSTVEHTHVATTNPSSGHSWNVQLYASQIPDVGSSLGSHLQYPLGQLANGQDFAARLHEFSNKGNPQQKAQEQIPKRGTKRHRGNGRDIISGRTHAAEAREKFSSQNQQERGHRRSDTRKPDTYVATKSLRTQPISSPARTDKPITPPRTSFLGRRTPEEQYAKIPPEIKRIMIRRHFIGEDIEYLRELSVSGVQSNMTERDIRDVIGDFAAVDQIVPIPDRAGAVVSFFSTADARRVLAESEIRCKGRPLFFEVPHRFFRTGQENSDYKPPISFADLRQDGRPRANHTSSNSKGFLKYSALGQTLDGHRRKALPSRISTASEQLQRNTTLYSPQDARSSLVSPVSGLIETTWASVAAGASIGKCTTEAASSTNPINEKGPKGISVSPDTEEHLTLGITKNLPGPETLTEPFPHLATNAFDVQNLTANSNTDQSSPQVVVQSSSFNNDLTRQVTADTTNETSTHTETNAAISAEGLALNSTEDSESPALESSGLQPSITDDQSIFAQVSELQEQELVGSALSNESVMQVDEPTEDFDHFDEVRALGSSPEITNEHPDSKDNPEAGAFNEQLPADLSGSLVEPTQDAQSLEDAPNDDRSEFKGEQNDISSPEPSPAKSQMKKVKPTLPAINTRRTRSSTGSSSTDPGSPLKSSVSAARHLAREIIRAREEEDAAKSSAQVNNQKKFNKVSGQCSQATTSKTSPSKSARRKSSPSTQSAQPASDHKNTSPAASRRHSPSASRDQSNKGSPSPQDLGRWTSEYDKAKTTISQIPDSNRSAIWSRELETLKSELENLEERYAQSYDKYLQGTKSGKKSAKKSLSQVARTHKEKIEELVMLSGRMSREVEPHASVVAAAKPKFQNYPAFYQPTAQENLATPSIYGHGQRSSSMSALQNRELVMTPQLPGSALPSIDSVLVDDDEFQSLDALMQDDKQFFRCKSDSSHDCSARQPIEEIVTENNDTNSPARSPKLANTVSAPPKSYASVAASGTLTASITQTRGQANMVSKPMVGLGIAKSTSSKTEKQLELGEWEAPEGPWGQAGLSSKTS